MRSKIILFILVSAFLLAGCSKEDTVIRNSLSFAVDGINKEVNNPIVNTPLNPDNFLSIYGNFQEGNIELQLNEQDMLLPGTYMFDNESLRFARLDIISGPGNTTTYIAGKSGFLEPLQGSGQITLTEVTPDYVKGNFEFVTGTAFPSNTFKTVTNGYFEVIRN